MGLTREVLEARLEALRAGLRQAQAEREQAIRQELAIDGAIQECEWAIAQMDAPEPGGETNA